MQAAKLKLYPKLTRTQVLSLQASASPPELSPLGPSPGRRDPYTSLVPISSFPNATGGSYRSVAGSAGSARSIKASLSSSIYGVSRHGRQLEAV